MTDINIIFGLLFLGVMCGAMYSSYRIGFREGTGSMIDFCKKKAKGGLVTIHFFGQEIEFIDTMEYNRKVLNSIVDKLDDDASS